MFNVNFLFQDGTVEKVDQFFSGQPQAQKKLVDNDIVSIIFACRAINNLSGFKHVCSWAARNRPNLIKKISRGIVIADSSLTDSKIDLSFKLYDMNDAELAFTLISALDTHNTEVFNAAFSVLEKKSQLQMFDFLARVLYFKFKNHNIFSRNGTALNKFIKNIDFIQDQMTERKFQSTLLRKTRSAALCNRHDFGGARMSLEGLDDRDVLYARLQIDFREALVARNFKLAHNFGISMIESMLDSPWFRSRSRLLGRFDANACLIALRRTYELLDVDGLNPFLISGTLLGMVRDGKIFDHDKDFDIAVIGWEKQFDVFEILYKSGEYDLDVRKLRGDKTSLLSVLHRPTGIACDIFFMREKNDHLLHCVDLDLGFTVQFLFSKFDLGVEKFGDDNFRIPVQWEKNLSENYGDGWRFPDKGYDVLLESPVIYDKSSASFKTLALDRILGSVVSNDEVGLKRKVSFLRNLLNSEDDEYSSFIRRLSAKKSPWIL